MPDVDPRNSYGTPEGPELTDTGAPTQPDDAGSSEERTRASPPPDMAEAGVRLPRLREIRPATTSSAATRAIASLAGWRTDLANCSHGFDRLG
jgi:hypothetical protein